MDKFALRRSQLLPTPPPARSRTMSRTGATPPLPPRTELMRPVPKPRVSSPPTSPSGSSTASPTPPTRLPPPLASSSSSSDGGPAGHERFGSCLQTCYEAINKRHEEELRALESLRVHISNRARADKEYAESLARINQRANRGVASITQQSAIVQVSVGAACANALSPCVQCGYTSSHGIAFKF